MTVKQKVWVNVLSISVLLHLMILTALGYYAAIQIPIEKKTEISEVVEVELGEQVAVGRPKSTSSSQGAMRQNTTNNNRETDNSRSPTQAVKTNISGDNSQSQVLGETAIAVTGSISGMSAQGTGQGSATDSGGVSGNASKGGGTNEASGKTATVAVVYSPRPQYPSIARTNGWEGTVRVKVQISPQGTVVDTVIVSSSGYDSIDDAALNSLHQWRFTPAYQNGKAVSAKVVVPIIFNLQ